MERANWGCRPVCWSDLHPLFAGSFAVQSAQVIVKSQQCRSLTPVIVTRASTILVAVLLDGCASGEGRPVERTVFNNPFAAPVLNRTGIGPQCEVAIGRDSTCLDPRFIIARRGRYATLRNGETVRLTRAQVETLHERAKLIAGSRNPPPPAAPPPPPEVPTNDAGDKL